MSKHLENAIIYLIRKERFYAEMLNRMQKIWIKDPNIVPTAGVAVTTEGIKLYLNHWFVADQTVEGLAAILKHECEHPMRGHLEREKALEPDLHKDSEKESVLDRFKKASRAYNLNLAEDYAINQDLKGLPDKFRLFDINGVSFKNDKGEDIWYTPALLKDLQEAFPNRNIQTKQAMEYYYQFLQKESEKNGGKPQYSQEGNMVVTIDCHDILDNSLEKIDPAFAKAIIQKTVNEAVNSLTSQQAGSLPGHLKILIDKLNRASKNWKQELRLFKALCSSSEVEETRRRRNRRYGLLYPGKRSKDITHIAVAVDSSGSTQAGWKQFFSEIEAMAKTGVKITFIECDAAIQKVCSFDKNFEPKVKGGGGTLFKPVFDLIKDKKFIKEYGKVNGLIYFTDGDNFEGELEQPKCKVLWALLPNCKVKYSWGNKIHIEIKET